MRGLVSRDIPKMMNTSTIQILTSKYHFSINGTGCLREIADYSSQAGKGKDKLGIIYYARKQ